MTANCNAATAYLKRELENVLPAWRAVLTSAEKELTAYETLTQGVSALQRKRDELATDWIVDESNDAALPIVPTEDAQSDELPTSWVEDESNDAFRRDFPSQAKSFSDEFYEYLRDPLRKGVPNLQDFRYEDEQPNAPWRMQRYTDFVRREKSRRDYFNRAPVPARDWYGNANDNRKWENDNLRLAEMERLPEIERPRRFEDMERLGKMRRPQRFSRDDFDIKKSQRFPWTK